MADLDLILTEAKYITNQSGGLSFNITDQGRLRMQTKQTDGSDLYTMLDITCPAGKKWAILFNVNITETDV